MHKFPFVLESQNYIPYPRKLTRYEISTKEINAKEIYAVHKFRNCEINANLRHWWILQGKNKTKKHKRSFFNATVVFWVVLFNVTQSLWVL